MKYKICLFALVFLILLLPVNVKAQAQYNGSLATEFQSGTEFIMPKIGCQADSNGQIIDCLAIFYDNVTNYIKATYFENISVLWDYDIYNVDFNTEPQMEHQKRDYRLPYAVRWGDDEKYWILASDRIYSFDPATRTVNLEYDLGFQYSLMDFSETTGNPVGIWRNDGTGLWKIETYMNGTIKKQTELRLAAGCNAGGGNACHIRAGGFMWSYDIYNLTARICTAWAVGCTAWGDFNYSNINTSGVFQYDYWENNYLVYRNATTESDMDAGVFRRYTTDFITFGSQEEYYSNNTDYVSWQDQFHSSQGDYWVYDAYRVTAGLWIYGQEYHPILITATATDWGTGLEETATTLTANLTNGNYTQQETGSIITLSTPTLTGNHLSFYTPDLIPTNYENTSMVFNNDCTMSMLKLNYIRKPRVEFHIIDSLTGEVISDASVTLGSSTRTSDANGRVVFRPNPFEDSSFRTIGDIYDDCRLTYRIDINETLLTYDLYSQHNEYNTYFEESITFPQGKTTHVIKMDKAGTRGLVRLFTLDGYEIMPTNLSVSAETSTHNVYVLYGAKFLNQSIAYVLPAQFLFENLSFPNETMYANFTVNVLNQTYTSTNYEMEVNATNPVNIYTDYMAENSPCLGNADCVPSHCVNKYRYDLVGCRDNECQYAVELCASGCDELYGCYKYKLTDSCDDDWDCESTCQTKSTSLTGLCGADGFCIQKEFQCEGSIVGQNETYANFCDTASGLCYASKLCRDYGFTSQQFFIGVDSIGASTNFWENLYCVTLGQWDENCWVTPNFTMYVREKFTCNIITAYKSECISGTTVNRSETTSGMYVIPEDWPYTSIGNTQFRYWDVAVRCFGSEGCILEYDFCEYGCFDGQCLAQPETEGTAVVRDLWNVLFGLIPRGLETPIWLLVMLAVMIMIGFAGMERNYEGAWRMGLMSLLPMALFGIVMGFLPPWIVFILIFGVVWFIASKLFHQTGD